MTNAAAEIPDRASACCSPTAKAPEAQTTTLGGLLRALEAHRDYSLAFVYGDRSTKPGYHLTEFKFARVTGLDCGANVESWTETILQLWDIETSVTGETMTVGKLMAIARKAIATVGAEENSRVVFEVSDGTDAMRIYAFDRVEATDGVATVYLAANVSACKPLVRGTLNAPGACAPKPTFASKQGSVPVRRPPASSDCCGK